MKYEVTKSAPVLYTQFYSLHAIVDSINNCSMDNKYCFKRI